MELSNLTPAIEARLRTALKLSDSAALPDDLVEIYDDVTRTARRLGFQPGDRELLLVAMLAKKPTPAEPLSFLDHAKDCNRGDVVLAKFRNAWRWGKFVRADDFEKKIYVVLDDDTGEERAFKATGVRFPTREELQAIGEV